MHYCNMLMLVVLCEGIIELTCMQKSDTISNIQSAILIPKKKKKRRRKGEEKEKKKKKKKKKKKNKFPNFIYHNSRSTASAAVTGILPTTSNQ